MDWKRALALGFISWLAPFVVSVMVFPLKASHPPLFDVVLSVVLTATVVGLGCAYLRRPGLASLGTAAAVGGLWMAMNIGLDLLLFTWGPMAMPALTYLTDIGLSYLVHPIILGGLHLAARTEALKIRDARSA